MGVRNPVGILTPVMLRQPQKVLIPQVHLP